MNSDIHIRARALICESALEMLSAADDRWLGDHLAGCADCRAQQVRMQQAVEAVRAKPVMAPQVLVARTRAIVRGRSRELQESTARTRMLMICSALALGWTVLAIPALWAMYGWMTGTASLTASGMTWVGAMSWIWLMPALFGVAVLLTNRNGQQPVLSAAQKGWNRD